MLHALELAATCLVGYLVGGLLIGFLVFWLFVGRLDSGDR